MPQSSTFLGTQPTGLKKKKIILNFSKNPTYRTEKIDNKRNEEWEEEGKSTVKT
jgi:hypothetical protein